MTSGKSARAPSVSSPNKRQHTVPQGYLQHWADPSKRVFVYDKQSGTAIQPHVRNVAVQNRFYSGSEDPPDLERAIAELESAVLPAHGEVLAGTWRILDGDFDLVPRLLPPERKQSLADAIAFQFARSPLVRRMTGITGEEEARAAHVNLMARGYQYLAGEFLKYVWIIAINVTAAPFYTSDNPVVASPPAADAPDSDSARPADIVFPLSPICLLWLWDPDSNPGQVPRDGQAVVADEDDVEEANVRQVLLADRHVISVSPDFALARRILTPE